MLCLHHCNSRTQEIPFYLPGQLRLFSEYYWTLKMYIYIFSIYSMMSELYLCVQVFCFFYEHGCVDPHPSPTAPHAHLHLHLLLRIYRQDIATKNLHSRSIDATASSPASLCTMSESQTDICERWLTHPCSHSHQSVKKKKAYVQYA